MPADDPNSHTASIEVAVDPHPELLLVDYRVGPDPESLRRLTQARIVPGAELERSPDSCVITLTTWHGAAHSDASWARTYHAYKTEMHLIKGRLENEFPAGV